MAFCCMLPVLTGLVLASIPALTAWFSRREQKAAANAYLTYAAAMDEAAVERRIITRRLTIWLWRRAARWNAPLCRRRTP